MPRHLFLSLALLGAALPALAASTSTAPLVSTSTTPVVEYPGATWFAAAPTNFTVSNRPAEIKIDRVVMHDIEGTAASCLSWFSNPAAKASAHYVLAGDGRVWQMLRERDIGWHAGNWDINQRSVGIEMEGFAYRPGFFNAVQYEEAARLVRAITTRHAIPRDREHIIGHFEVPHPREPGKFGGASGHTDPGPYWDWAAFMALVRHDATLIEAKIPAVIRPGEVLPASVAFQNTGDDAWPASATQRKNDAAPEGNFEAAPVYLGTAEGRTSAFWSLKGWASPRFAASATGEAAPSTSARYDFTLSGPRALGEHAEEWRLAKVPVAAQGAPLSFGPTVRARVRVVPWDLIRPADVPTATASGAPASTSGARWTVPLPISGTWEVGVRAPSRAGRPLALRVATSDGERTITLPRAAGSASGGWRSLGKFRFEGAALPPGATFPASGVMRGSTVALVQAAGEPFAGEVRCIGPLPEPAALSGAATP